MKDQDKLLKVNTPAGTDILLVEPEPNYIVKSPGMTVRFGDGTILHMNRATRRKNKLYGSRVKRTGKV